MLLPDRSARTWSSTSHTRTDKGRSGLGIISWEREEQEETEGNPVPEHKDTTIHRIGWLVGWRYTHANLWNGCQVRQLHAKYLLVESARELQEIQSEQSERESGGISQLAKQRSNQTFLLQIHKPVFQPTE